MILVNAASEGSYPYPSASGDRVRWRNHVRSLRKAAMTVYRVKPSGREAPFNEDEIIVSKTDLKGRITYANDVFCRVAGFTPNELLSQPHSIIRHPDMPRAVFKLLWATLAANQEIFAYVLNMAKSGDHYWVFAHITPSYGADGTAIGYHSNRRKPDASQVAKIARLYRGLLDIEAEAVDPKIGMNQAFDHLVTTLHDKGISYDEFVFGI
jgi:PAS domain S-box-containing protein